MPSLEISNESDILDTIDRIIKGETLLYEDIVRAYDKYLYKIGRSYGFSHSDTEDLMQETLVNAYFHLKDFQNRSTFKTWIVTIMLHECYHKKHRAGYKKEFFIDGTLNKFPVKENSENLKDEVSNIELKQKIEEAIVLLPEIYRNVFTLRELNGLSVRETATALNISEANVKVRLNRAKKMLQLELQKTYSAEDIFEFNLIYCEAIVKRVMAAIDERTGKDSSGQ